MKKFPCLTPHTDAVELKIKVVPNASRDRMAGMLGDRLKVSVSAAPEQGKANDAVCRLIEKKMKLAKRSVTVASGQTSPMKTLRLEGIDLQQATERLCKLV